MAGSKFLNDGRTCLGCGSSMLRQGLSEESRKLEITCFCCGANVTELTQHEDYDYEETLEVMGREYGSAGKILTRINTPGKRPSYYPSREEAIGFSQRRKGYVDSI